MQFPSIHYIRSLNIRPSKKHGQNFLIDKNMAEKIVAAAGISHGEVIIEIGPGLGSLTYILYKLGVSAYCYEIDGRLCEILSSSLPKTSSINIIHENFLRISFKDLAARHRLIVLLGSIPYSLTTQILFKFLEESRYISRAVFVVQKEVAERLCARPGTKSYGILSVYCAAYAPPSILFTIPADCFYPAPEVSSAAILLRPKKEKVWDDPYEVLFRHLVRTAFSRRRKTLLNSLKSICALHDLHQKSIVEKCVEVGLDMKRRPETLTCQEWYTLTSLLQGKPPATINAMDPGLC